MRCVNCGKPATAYVKMVGGEAITVYLCASCAEKLRREEELKQTQGESKEVCFTCGTTLSDFRRTALLGCPDCYTCFRDEILKTVRIVQGKSLHEGKTPAVNVSGDFSYMFRVDNLQAESEHAIREKKFTEANILAEKLKFVKLKR